MPRMFVEHGGVLWAAGQTLDLPEGAARHVQVLRLQPGDALTLFDGRGGEWAAEVRHMGRRDVSVCLHEHQPADRELSVPVTLVVGMPANDRMDALVEKATELGAAVVQPLVCQRSVLRLEGDRATKKVAHWQGVAVAASEQCGRTRVPDIRPVLTFRQWMDSSPLPGAQRGVLSFAPQRPVSGWLAALDIQAPGSAGVAFLSGPEGGLHPEEEARAIECGWLPVGLGPRVLRADTAPLMALSLVNGLLG